MNCYISHDQLLSCSGEISSAGPVAQPDQLINSVTSTKTTTSWLSKTKTRVVTITTTITRNKKMVAGKTTKKPVKITKGSKNKAVKTTKRRVKATTKTKTRRPNFNIAQFFAPKGGPRQPGGGARRSVEAEEGDQWAEAKDVVDPAVDSIDASTEATAIDGTEPIESLDLANPDKVELGDLELAEEWTEENAAPSSEQSNLLARHLCPVCPADSSPFSSEFAANTGYALCCPSGSGSAGSGRAQQVTIYTTKTRTRTTWTSKKLTRTRTITKTAAAPAAPTIAPAPTVPPSLAPSMDPTMPVTPSTVKTADPTVQPTIQPPAQPTVSLFVIRFRHS